MEKYRLMVDLLEYGGNLTEGEAKLVARYKKDLDNLSKSGRHLISRLYYKKCLWVDIADRKGGNNGKI